MDNYVNALSGPSPAKTNPSEPTRRSVTYHPNVWGDHFLKYHLNSKRKDDNGTKQRIEQLKEQVRNMIVNGGDNSEQQLMLIDEIQRLGVSYHFESDISVVLNNHFLKQNGSSCDTNLNDNDDLYMVSLCFRLLRQHGHRVSCDIFNKFKGKEGKFVDYLIDDKRGLLSLYEATHMRVHEERILDEALEFTTTHLEEQLNNSSLKSQVFHTLNYPIRKGLNRILARRYIPIYQQENSHNRTLLEFAKLDFNMLQKIHQRELSHITMWWKDLNVAEKLPFARDRISELYFWIMEVYFEPQYVFARKILTKVIALTSIIDDTFDNYGTIEELTLFNDVIQRWDANVSNQLPEYMKHIYQNLFDIYSEMEEELFKQGRSHHVEYAILAMKKLVRAYFDEAIWYEKSYVPTIEEYMEVALVTSAHEMLATTSFVVGAPEFVTDEALNWVISDPLIVRGSSVMCRLTDDIVGHEFEQERGHIASAVECYMKQYGSTKEEVFVEFNKRITNAWKDMNQGCLHPTVVPMTLLERVLNLSRVINLLYKDNDGYTHSKTKVKNYISAILVDSVPV